MSKLDEQIKTHGYLNDKANDCLKNMAITHSNALQVIFKHNTLSPEEVIETLGQGAKNYIDFIEGIGQVINSVQPDAVPSDPFQGMTIPEPETETQPEAEAEASDE